MITREEFIAWWDNMVPENPADREDHPLWIPEHSWQYTGLEGALPPSTPSQWFVKHLDCGIITPDYWSWCDANLKGTVRCYMLDTHEDGDWAWWGFTDRDDIVLWMLKWA